MRADPISLGGGWQRRGRWLASPQTPKVPQPQLPWPAFPSDVVELRPAVFAGREVERVSFVDPRTPAWYTVSADARTHVVVRVDMVAPAHFMRDEYTTLDAPFRIRPPR